MFAKTKIGVFVFVLFLSSASSALEGRIESSKLRNCGIYCSYAALEWFERDVPISSILTLNYISNGEGSTLSDLARLFEDNGLYARAVKNLRVTSLNNSPYPIICSVRRSITDGKFNHYVIVLPTEDGPRLAYDPLVGTTEPVDSLIAGSWSGYGLLVGDEEIRLWRIFWRDYVALFLVSGLLLGVRMVLRKKGPRLPSKTALSADVLILVFLMLMISVVADHSFRTKPLLARGPGVRAVQERHFEAFLPQLTANQMERLLELDESILVDARIEADYALGHIGNAINIGPSNDDRLDEILRDVSKDRHLVVYCHSATCPYAGQVARLLYERGYKKLSYFKQGWIGWKKHLLRQGKEVKP